jgi:hypothetical protein
MKQLGISLHDLLWLTLAVGLTLGWLMDRTQLYYLCEYVSLRLINAEAERDVAQLDLRVCIDRHRSDGDRYRLLHKAHTEEELLRVIAYRGPITQCTLEGPPPPERYTLYPTAEPRSESFYVDLAYERKGGKIVCVSVTEARRHGLGWDRRSYRLERQGEVFVSQAVPSESPRSSVDPGTAIPAN